MIRLEHAPILASIINCIHLIVAARRDAHKWRQGPMTEEERGAALDAAAAVLGEPLAWRTSIVDLLKTLRLDSSAPTRGQLAWELGYTGALADMNVWLHAQVMAAVAERNLLVPPT